MGFRTSSCMVFCYLNALCAFFISYLFSIQQTSMAVVSYDNGWDTAQKAKSIRRAGILYVICAVFLTVRYVKEARRFTDDGAMHPRPARFEWEEGIENVEALPLLSSQRGTAAVVGYGAAA